MKKSLSLIEKDFFKLKNIFREKKLPVFMRTASLFMKKDHFS
jgi:hypothetical protein